MNKRVGEYQGGIEKKAKTESDIDESLINHNKEKVLENNNDNTDHNLTTTLANHGLSTSGFQPTTLSNKPQHGSEEWHRQRKENHKNVEKRRRESINLGIKELAALIPTSDTNKSQILQRAVEYIKRLKENEANNIEKWTLEKLLTEQAVTELDNSNQKLKQELEKCYREIENYKKLLEKK